MGQNSSRGGGGDEGEDTPILGRRGERENPDALLKRQFEIATEIVASEEVYVTNLGFLVMYYVKPVDARNLLPHDRARAIFSVIEAIQTFHADFLDKMRERLALAGTPEDQQQPLLLGDLFLQMSDFLKMYPQFINNYVAAAACVSECEKRYPGFKSLLEETRTLPEARGLGLLDLLIQPVQRVPRYILLLQDLVEHTNPRAQDYRGLVEALRKVKDIADFINTAKRLQEGQEQILGLQRAFGSTYRKPLLLPHRGLLKEGGVSVVGKTKKYRLVLFSDVLIYGRVVTGLLGGEKLVGSQQQMNFKHEFPLSRTRVEPVLTEPMPAFRVTDLSLPLPATARMVSSSSSVSSSSKGKAKDKEKDRKGKGKGKAGSFSAGDKGKGKAKASTTGSSGAVKVKKVPGQVTFSMLTIGERDEWVSAIEDASRALRQQQSRHRTMVQRKGKQKRTGWRKYLFCGCF